MEKRKILFYILLFTYTGSIHLSSTTANNENKSSNYKGLYFTRAEKDTCCNNW